MPIKTPFIFCLLASWVRIFMGSGCLQGIHALTISFVAAWGFILLLIFSFIIVLCHNVSPYQIIIVFIIYSFYKLEKYILLIWIQKRPVVQNEAKNVKPEVF
jgi:hypothetical protein